MKFLGRVPYEIKDGRVYFLSNDLQCSWSCVPFNLDAFFTELEGVIKKHGWITPWDCREQACKAKLASYS